VAKVAFDGPTLDVAANGLHLKANLEKQERLVCEGEEPGAADFLLAIDGKDLGREILQDVEPIAAYRRMMESPDSAGALVPGRPFEVESAPLIMPPFQVGEDPAASGGKFVWMPGRPGEPGGSPNARAVIPVRVPAAGTYYLWARILTPTPSDDSFFFRIRFFSPIGRPDSRPQGWPACRPMGEKNWQGPKELLPRTDWQPGVRKSWEWAPVELGPGKQRALTLPAGVMVLEVICREDGSKMDQILLTPDPNWKP